jgi:hypothetical protein
MKYEIRSTEMKPMLNAERRVQNVEVGSIKLNYNPILQKSCILHAYRRQASGSVLLLK